MKKTTGLYAAALAATFTMATAGCADVPKPTESEQAAADYGYAPVHYKEAITSYFAATLKDPSSIQVGQMSAPTRGFFQVQAPLLSGGKVTNHYGWLVTASINAKNSYGGYVGFRTYGFMFNGEEIIHTDTPSD